jgi:parallel beta-helix repeat protein
MNKKISTLAILACLSISIIAISIPVKLVRGYTLVPPIVIASNADFDLYDSGGDGSPLNPWIIENIEIDCASAGSGISISGTTDYAIIRDSYIHNSGSGALDAGIAISGSINVELLNITIEDAGAFGIVLYVNANNNTVKNCTLTRTGDAGIALAYVADSNNITGNTLRNCSTVANNAAIKLLSVSNDIIEFNDIDQSNLVQASITADTALCCIFDGNLVVNTNLTTSSMGITIIHCVDNIIKRNSVSFTPAPIEIQDSENTIIINNTITNSPGSSRGIICDDSCENNTIAGNVVEGQSQAGIAVMWNQLGFTNIFNNTIHNCQYGVYIDSGATGTFVYENYFDSCMYIMDSCEPVNVTHCFFYNNSAFLVPFSIATFNENYYDDHFTFYPDDITTNVTMIELTSTYVIDATHNDTHPRYCAPFYPRSTQVFFNFFSNVDGQGIPFGNLHVLLDSVPLTITSPVINHVLFRITASDYHGRLLYDEVLNLNDTGIYIDIGLDVAVQIFISYYSNVINYLGIPFEKVKLFIDGVRYTRYDPIMQVKVISINVTDFANVTIYSKTVNLSTSGIFLDIPLPIIWMSVTNYHPYKVIFKITRHSVTNTVALGYLSSFGDYMALGTYTWQVLDKNGTRIENETVTFASSSPGDWAIDLGWDTFNPNPVIIQNNAGLLDYFIVFSALGIGFALVIKTKTTKGKAAAAHASHSRPHR